MLNEIFKPWLEKNFFKLFPGLGLVVVLGEQLSKVFLRGAEGIWEILLFAPMVVVCLVSWFIGRGWDDLLYDPLFSVASPGSLKQLWVELLFPTPQTKRRKITINLVRRLWRWLLSPLHRILGLLPPARKLKLARIKASRALNKRRARNYDYEGLYKTAESLLSRTKEYEKKIEGPLESSKFARSFLFPLLALAIYRFMFSQQPWKFGDSGLRLLWNWKFDLVVFGLFLIGYVYLRMLHMRRLFDLVASLVAKNKLTFELVPQNDPEVPVKRPMLKKDLPYMY